MPEVLLVQAVVGQQEQGQAATATVHHVAFPHLGHSQCGARLVQTLAEFLDSRIPQLVVAHLQYPRDTVLGQGCAEVVAADSRKLQDFTHGYCSWQPVSCRLSHAARHPCPPAHCPLGSTLQALLGPKDVAQISAAPGGDVTVPEPQSPESGAGV